jgi:integrase
VTVALATAPWLEAAPEVVELRRLQARVDLAALVARGWDPGRRVFAPAADDALFGYHLCERVRCPRAGDSDRARALGLCEPCTRSFLRSAQLARTGEPQTLAQFKATGLRRHVQAETEQTLCLVCRTPGHERIATNRGLCRECNRLRHARGQSIAGLVAGDERFAPARPRKSFGRCLVDGCGRWAWTGERLCKCCRMRLRKIPAVERPTLEQFVAKGPWTPQLVGDHAVMPALPELVEWQLLAGLGMVIAPFAVVTPLDRLSMAWAHVARAGVASVLDLDPGDLPGTYASRRAVEIAVLAARRLTTTPEQERAKDVWDLGVFGIAEMQALDFTHLHQRWLREAAKGYTIERLATRKARTAHRDLLWLAHLSDYLRVREDRGEHPAALTREDMSGFLFWLTAKVPTKNKRHLIVSATRRNVQFARRELSRPGQLAEHIGAGFQLYHEDMPERTTRDPDEHGRALPGVVLAQLLDEDQLAALGSDYLEYRVAFELMAHSGRRPGEICGLAADCLRYEEEPTPNGGKQRRPVLRYLREKPPSKWLSLPINQDAAELIEAQQRRLRSRFPDIKLSKLALLPRRRCNPTGRLPMASATLGFRVNKWVKAMPALLDGAGSTFPLDDVFLYALRHSYAQRHADEGVPLDTLQKLMDHRTAATTQIYYRVTWERKREAIDRVAPLTMDKNGRRVGFHSSMVESERLRQEIGRIPVPLGYCVEQHNVKALGAHCPFSHQCLGCDHFRTDPSHLPDLYAYLERLLETRERLRVAVPELAEWARTKAIPADAEIRTVRTLIRAGEGALDELQPDEQAKLLELVRVLRATRARMDGTIDVELVGATRNPEPTFTPPAFTPLPSPRALPASTNAA